MSWVGMTISLLPVTMLARLALPISQIPKELPLAKRMNWFALATVAYTLNHVANSCRLIYFLYIVYMNQ